MKYRILYAATNSGNSYIQLERFLNSVDKNKFFIKVAAYKKSSPNINIDWTLDSLFNMFRPGHVSLDNDNYQLYFKQVKEFDPDLIISDLEYFTSNLAILLNKPLWQCSSNLLNFALPFDAKYNIGIFKNYSYLFNRNPMHHQRTNNLINNSSKNFIYSHFGDLQNPPPIQSNFEWIRPYFYNSKEHKTCSHTAVGLSFNLSKHILQTLNNIPDSVLFSNVKLTNFNKIITKNLNNIDEYFCNVKNSNLIICDGSANFLSDIFYSEKYAIIIPDTTEPDCIKNALLSSKFGLGSVYFEYDQNIINNFDKKIELNLNNKFLHEKLGELCGI